MSRSAKNQGKDKNESRAYLKRQGRYSWGGGGGILNTTSQDHQTSGGIENSPNLMETPPRSEDFEKGTSKEKVEKKNDEGKGGQRQPNFVDSKKGRNILK